MQNASISSRTEGHGEGGLDTGYTLPKRYAPLRVLVANGVAYTIQKFKLCTFGDDKVLSCVD